MNTYVCNTCNNSGRNDCWRCRGKGVIELPKAVVEYRKRVRQLSEKFAVVHYVSGHEYEEYYDYEGRCYDASEVNEYYDREPIKEVTPTE